MTTRPRPAATAASQTMAPTTGIETAYGLIDERMAGRDWAAGENFSMADCTAAPALNYAKLIVPFGKHANIAAYHTRLTERPSFARALKESEPYLSLLATE
jgi:glutathione S-transferase